MFIISLLLCKNPAFNIRKLLNFYYANVRFARCLVWREITNTGLLNSKMVDQETNCSAINKVRMISLPSVLPSTVEQALSG